MVTAQVTTLAGIFTVMLFVSLFMLGGVSAALLSDRRRYKIAQGRAERLSAAVHARYGASIAYPDRVALSLEGEGDLHRQVDSVLLTLHNGETVICTLDIHEVGGVLHVKAISGSGELPALANH